MSKKRWIVLTALVVFFTGLLLYGIKSGDADYVYKNATNFCFT